MGPARSDSIFLRRTTRPDYEGTTPRVRIVDLFAGCGGMTLGVAEAAFRSGLGTDVVLAVDNDRHAIETFNRNFPPARFRPASVETTLGRSREARQARESAVLGGPIHFLLGGPPCQGHSNLNNHTRRQDPKNTLYGKMATAARLFGPQAIIVENVPAVVRDRGRIVARTAARLRRQGYRVAESVVDLLRIGVPQSRRRHVLLATRGPLRPATEYMLELLRTSAPPRDVRWAIGDLESRTNGYFVDIPSKQSAENCRRAQWLFDHAEYDLPDHQRPPCHRDKRHSYRSAYGRLRWDLPAQTITSGFGSMGQGRYVHPGLPRTLTPHEAARLQFFPDFFDWGEEVPRRALSAMIANAVPPQLTAVLAASMLQNLPI